MTLALSKKMAVTASAVDNIFARWKLNQYVGGVSATHGELLTKATQLVKNRTCSYDFSCAILLELERDGRYREHDEILEILGSVCTEILP